MFSVFIRPATFRNSFIHRQQWFGDMYNIYPFVSYTSKLKHYIQYLIHQMSDIFFSVSTFLVIIISMSYNYLGPKGLFPFTFQ